MAAKKHARFALYVLVIGLLHAAWAAKKDDIVVDGCVTQFSCSDLTGPDISRTYIPDPVDCSVYYRCNGINLVRESCPSGEGFSTSSAACESLDDADCQSACLSGSGIRAIYEPDEPTMKPTPVSGWQVPDSTLNPCVTVVDCRVLPELTTVPDPLNCSLYYQCVGSMLQRGECPLGQRFDSFLGCVNSTRVRCLTCPNGGGILTLSTSTSPVTSSMTTEQATTSIYLTSTTVKTTKSTVPEGGNWQTPPTSFNPCLNVFDCSVLPDSTTVPDPTDCTNYYQCVNGQPVRRRCPDGGQFDFLIGCTPSSRVRCQTCPGGSGIITPTTPDSGSTAPVTTPARPSSTTVVTTPARPSSTTVVTTPINLVRTVDPCQGEPVCNDSDIALYWPHKDDCILYFECTAGTIQPRQCPENYLFDTITNSCQNPLNATCQQPCSITYSTSESGSISGSTPKSTAHLSSYPVDVSSDVTTAGFSTVYLPCGVDPPCLNETVSLKWPFHHNICNRKYYECNFGVVSERQCEPSDRFSVDVSDCKRASEATCIVICVELSTSDTGEGLSTQGLTSTITSTETTTSDLLSTDSFFSSTGSWTLQNPCDPWDVCSPGQMLPIPGQCKDYRHCVMGKWQTKQCNGSVKPFFDQETHECSAEPNCMPDCFEHDLSVDTDEILEGHRVQFTCSFKPTEQWGPQLVRYNWALDGIGIRGMPEGSRIQIYQKKDPLDGVWESQLIFSPIHFDDRGSVRCEAVFNYTSGTEKTNTVEKWSNVIPLPTATITPLTVSKEQGQMVLIMCSGDAAAAKLTWYRDGTEISDDDDDVSLPGNGTVQTLIVKVKGNATYACQAQNSAGLSNMADCSITLILTVKHVCNATEARDVRWTDTVAGGINMQHCIPPSTGYATRRCSWDDDGDEAMWEEPNFNACVDEEFTILVNKVKRLEEGIGASNSSYIAEVSREIKDASAPVQDKTSPGNINLTTESLTLLATLRNSDDSAPIDDEEVENVVNTVSNLLSEDNFVSWESLSRDDVSRPALLMKCMDIYGQKKAEQLPVNEQLNIMSPNTVLQADSLGKNTSRTMTYPRRTDAPDWITDSEDFIRIEQDTLLSLINDIHGDKFILSSSYYRTINSILPTVSENKSVASRIVALSIQGLTSDTLLSPPVEYSLLHDQSEENYTYACSFWNYSIDGGDWSVRGCRKVTMVDGRTTCQCDHLTNFAIIISPSPATDGIHYTILSVISLVGCVVSLVALVVTILIYVTMWKNLKSHQAVVLLNLCVALIIANVVFVAGIDKTEPEILCTIVAVLLHYFYLAAFFIMLVEGIELLLYIMYVFHVHRKRETAMLLITAWLLPLTIVGITMGVTKLDGYGNENFCWLTLDNGLLWAFVGPVLFIILVNFVIFVIVLRRITTAKIPTDVNNGKRRNRVKASLWNIVVITPILGLTWLFGVFAVNDDTVWFQYVFCIFNSLQGLLICIFHACCNKKVRDKFSSKAPSVTPSHFSIGRLMAKQKNKSESSSRDKYKMKSSTQTKSSRLKSDSSGKNSKSLSVQSDNKGMLESLTPQERELYMRQLSESKEVPYGMDFISGNSDVSSGYSSQLQSDISDRTFNTFVSEENGTDENGTTWKAQPNETTQTNGLIQPDHVQYREQKANNDTDQDETDKRPVEKVLSTTSC